MSFSSLEFLPYLIVDDLPEAMQQLAAVVGLGATKKILAGYGGLNLYIPKKGFPPSHPLRQQLTVDEQKDLVAAYQSSTIRIPYTRSALAKARIRVITADYENGLSVLDLRKKYQLHPDYLRRIIRAHRTSY